MAISRIMDTAVSGLAVQSAQVAASADNIANIHTPGFRPAEVRPVSLDAGDGLGAGVRGQVTRAPVEVAAGVDVATEFTRMIAARHAYEGSLALIRAADEMSKGIVNLKA